MEVSYGQVISDRQYLLSVFKSPEIELRDDQLTKWSLPFDKISGDGIIFTRRETTYVVISDVRGVFEKIMWKVCYSTVIFQLCTYVKKRDIAISEELLNAKI